MNFPYATVDVLAVHLLAAIPPAIVLAAFTSRYWNLTAARALGGLLLFAGVALVWFSAELPKTGQVVSSPLFGFVLRTAIALSIITGAALIATQLLKGLIPSSFDVLMGKWTVVLAAIVLPAATYTYESARCNHDRARLQEYLEQSRLGAAHTVAQRWLTLRPAALFQGKPLAEVSQQLQQAIEALTSRVDQPLPASATTPTKLNRARDLAMLGRNGAAIDVLSTVPELTALPAACNLLGTIAETEETWEEGAQWYRRARELCQAEAKTTGSSPELARATQGLAYCQRKQGDLAAAERTYLELLALSPTADNYFLLATFYEDTQQVTKAKTAARKAMALAPDRYQVQGERLIDKLITLHFGCLQSFAADD